MADWVMKLDGLPGLTVAQKGAARMLLATKSMEQASVHVSGDANVAAASIKALLATAGSAIAAAEEDDVIAKLAAETRRFTGHVLHTVKDPVTQMDAIDPKTGQAVLVPTCATVITPKCLATFAHDRKWKGGDEVEVKLHPAADTTSMRAVKAKVAIINNNADFIILEADTEMQAPDIEAGIKAGMKYYGHGMSSPGHAANVYHGVIASTNVQKYGLFFGDVASGKGDSGGGVFSATTGELMGLMVGRNRDLQKSCIIPAATLVTVAAALSKLAAELAGLQQRSTQCLLAADAVAACGAAADAAGACLDAGGATASSRSAAGSSAARRRAWQGHVQPLLSDLDFVSAIMSHWPQGMRKMECGQPQQHKKAVEVEEEEEEEEELQAFREAVEVAAALVAFADAQDCGALAALVRGMVSAAVAAAGQAAAAAVVPAGRRNSHGHDHLNQLPGGPVITTEAAAAAASAAGFAQAPPLPQLQQQPPAAMPPPLAVLLLAPQQPESLSVAAVTGSLLAKVVAATAAAAALHVRAAHACATAIEWAPSLPAPRATASLSDVTPPAPCFFLQPDGVGSGGGNSSGGSGRRSGGEAAGGGGGGDGDGDGGVLSWRCRRHTFLEDC